MSSAKAYSASEVITSILKQLCLSLQIVPTRLQQILERAKGVASYKSAFEESLEGLREISKSVGRPIIIMIDGFDKTNIRGLRDFAQVFSSLENTSFKCLVTSRSTRFVLPDAHNSFSEFVIEDDANEQDISNFIKCTLSDNPPIDRMLKGDPGFRDELIKTLISRAHGM